LKRYAELSIIGVVLGGDPCFISCNSA